MANSTYSVRQMPQTEAGSRTHWVSEKRARTLSLTEDCWQILGAMAQSIGNRSEVVEIIVRNALETEVDLGRVRDTVLPVSMNTSAGQPNSLDTCSVDAVTQQCSI